MKIVTKLLSLILAISASALFGHGNVPFEQLTKDNNSQYPTEWVVNWAKGPLKKLGQWASENAKNIAEQNGRDVEDINTASVDPKKVSAEWQQVVDAVKNPENQQVVLNKVATGLDKTGEAFKRAGELVVRSVPNAEAQTKKTTEDAGNKGVSGNVVDSDKKGGLLVDADKSSALMSLSPMHVWSITPATGKVVAITAATVPVTLGLIWLAKKGQELYKNWSKKPDSDVPETGAPAQ